jgi:hypothetical protein
VYCQAFAPSLAVNKTLGGGQPCTEIKSSPGLNESCCDAHTGFVFLVFLVNIIFVGVCLRARALQRA